MAIEIITRSKQQWTDDIAVSQAGRVVGWRRLLSVEGELLFSFSDYIASHWTSAVDGCGGAVVAAAARLEIYGNFARKTSFSSSFRLITDVMRFTVYFTRSTATAEIARDAVWM